MNVPSRDRGNWRWRFAPEMLQPDLALKLANLAEVTDRLPQPIPVDEEDWAA
jgi:4-alpha-glucanotransferase